MSASSRSDRRWKANESEQKKWRTVDPYEAWRAAWEQDDVVAAAVDAGFKGALYDDVEDRVRRLDARAGGEGGGGVSDVPVRIRCSKASGATVRM